MKIYNTKQEKSELKWLRKKFKESIVVCPNNDMGNLGSMDPYLKQVSKSDEVILSEFKNHIGKGVFAEVERALSEDKPVRVLRKNLGRYKLFDVSDIILADCYDWAVYYGKIIIKEAI